MKKHFCILFFFSFFIHFQTLSQETPNKIESKFSYAEKIYLQLSSTIFTTDNTIWFKAIVTDLAHVPTKTSSVLHVELIDFDERIIDSKLLKIEYGIADSFFDLKEDIPPGRYMLRAYTEWNKNFDNEFISQVYIDIYAPNEVQESEEAIREVTLSETPKGQFMLSAKAYPKLLNPKYSGKLKMYIHTGSKTDSVEIEKTKDDGYSFQYLLPKDAVKARMELKLDSIKLKNHNLGFVSTHSKTVVVNKDYLDLQFFPEGGKLVDGLTSVIAFKALDYDNKGKKINGYIVDEADNIITPFQSNTLGMGKTFLTPTFGKTYYAQIKNNDGVNLKFPLPKTHSKGAVLKVKEVQDYIVVSLKTNELKEAEFQVKVQSRGVVYDDFILQLKNESASAGLEKSSLPEGIIKFTITNKANQIVCERLFFNFKEEEHIHIKASPHLKAYNQRDKTVFDITIEDKNVNGVKSNLSVLVVNKEQLGKVNDTRGNILSYFLLHSELRGTIEEPSYYFSKKNTSRKQDIDALLLTQGWSNYKYDNSPFSTDFEFLPELGLTVSGSVKRLLNSKKDLNAPVDLTMIYGPLKVETQKVDSAGEFQFYLDDYYKDEFRVTIQTKTEKGKKKDFNINLDKYESPGVNYIKEKRAQLADSINIYLKENIARKRLEEELKVASGTIVLDEVKLDGYNMTPEREKMMDLHGPPDVVIENKELLREEEKWHWGLYSLLQSKYPNDIDVYAYPTDNPQYLKAEVIGRDVTLVVIDGVPVSMEEYRHLEDLPIEEIKSFEIIKRPKASRHYMSNNIYGTKLDENEEFISSAEPSFSTRIGFISIYTYAGKGFYGARRTQGIYKGFVSGFAPKREFYAPKYDDNSVNDENAPDLRSVVQWLPNINTDAEGYAQVEFYNGDNIGDMLVIVEGITGDGKIGYYETTYRVDKK